MNLFKERSCITFRVHRFRETGLGVVRHSVLRFSGLFNRVFVPLRSKEMPMSCTFVCVHHMCACVLYFERTLLWHCSGLVTCCGLLTDNFLFMIPCLSSAEWPCSSATFPRWVVEISLSTPTPTPVPLLHSLRYSPHKKRGSTAASP
eukprot:RCo026951